MNTIEDLIADIQGSSEWLESSTGDVYQCITLEELEGILTTFFNQEVKL